MFWSVLNGHGVDMSDVPESDVLVGSVFLEVIVDGMVKVSGVISKSR